MDAMDIDTQRYSRQIMLENIGYEGQIKLGKSTVTVVGAGGLGSPILQRLVTMGIGTVRVVDRDAIDVTNLHRQILFRDADVGEPKVEVAVRQLREMNPTCNVQAVPASVNFTSAPDIIKNSDVVIDALDSIAARYALNEACVDASIPFVTGGAVGVQGQVFTVLPGSACYNCVFPGMSDEMVPSCGIEGVHPAVLGIVGNIEVSEAVSILTENKPSLSGRMLHIDIESMTFTQTAVEPVPECSICGDKHLRASKAYGLTIEELCGRDMGKRTFAITPATRMSLKDALKRVERDSIVSKSDMGATILIDDTKVQLMEGGSAILIGARDASDAETKYHKACGK